MNDQTKATASLPIRCTSRPRLTDAQRAELFEPLFASTKEALDQLAGGDLRILWALRRKLTKELIYLERGTPQMRNALKRRKMIAQRGICPLCRQKLPASGAELDRKEAFHGYTDENTRLVHHGCHVADQQRKGYNLADHGLAIRCQM